MRNMAGWQSGHAAACKAVYAGSIPTPASIFKVYFTQIFIRGFLLLCYNLHLRGVAQPGSVLGWGPSGRRFESSRPDHIIKELGKMPSSFFFLCHLGERSGEQSAVVKTL